RRAVKMNSTYSDKWGYDHSTLNWQFIDEMTLSQPVVGTESLNGQYRHFPANLTKPFEETEDRFIALYGNASYELFNKYVLSGSVRMDQSNLFGQDPKLQYRPLWSVGAKWKLLNEQWMLQL